VLIILALSVPFDVMLRLDVYGRPRFRVRLVWLFGLVSKEIRKGPKGTEKKKKVVKSKRKRRGRGISARIIFKILRVRGLFRQFKVLVRDVLGCLKIRELGADFRVGFDNPADTGVLFAIMRPATLFLGPSFPHQIRVQPSFDGEAVFEGYLQGTARLQPIRLVPPFLRFIFSLATIRVIKILVLAKWKRQK
jgi:hypothetical protein